MTIFSRIKSIFSKDVQKKNQSLDDDLDNGPDYLNEEKNSLATSRLKSKRSDFKPQAKDDDDSFDWFADRYETLIVQRNISIFLLIIAILCIGLTGASLAVITKNKTIEPFVIEIEKKQGIVTYVNNNSKVQEYTQNEVLRNYFIKQYIEARETFDPVNYNYYYYKVVKAMSNEMTYRQFLYTLRSNGKDNPMVLFANNEASMVNIVSISILKDKVLQVRFVAEGRFADGKSVRANKVAVVEYDFLNLEMNEERRYINPLGFIVNSYRSTDENV